MNIKDFNNLEQWATQQWGQAELGDGRRNHRAIKMGAALAANPAASLPAQMGGWSELKAAYRLLDEQDVTYTGLSLPHWQQTQRMARQTDAPVVLFVQDTSEGDYTSHVKTEGLGHIGNSNGRGFELHSCLAILPDVSNPKILGISAQKVWTRAEIKRGTETRTQRANRASESDVWAEIVESIGQAPDPKTAQMWVSVGDRGSDVFSYLRRSIAQGWHCLLRICQDRVITTLAGERGRLLCFARSLPPMTDKSIRLRGRNGQPKRTVSLHIAWEQVTIHPPKRGTQRTQDPITGWCIRCWTPNVQAAPLEWILFTTVPITSATDAIEQVDWYSQRWVIEEYHKCLKTGCAVEQRQLTTADGLQRLLGFLAIVAVRLLQLRTLRRHHPDAAASAFVPPEMLRVLVARLSLPQSELTLHKFWRALAQLGGFIGRRSDGEPGWQTLWRGWQRLQDLCWGFASVAPG